MKTKLLLTISLICLLVASTQAAIPYEYFPNRSEADGETPGAQIPNCIQQRGYKCNACGPDTTKTPAVPLFPNGINQCIPNPAGSGCNRFLDVQGNVCDISQGCNCKFAVNSFGSTCVTSTVPNCFILASDGTCAQCIGLNRKAEYTNESGVLKTAGDRLKQTTPVGGGISDYGRSFDGKTCIDNLANGNPNCLEYLNATSCNKCDEDGNYALVQTGTPTASLRKCVKIPGFTGLVNNCLVYNIDGKRCATCQTNFVLSADQLICSPNTDQAFTITNAVANTEANCLRYEKGPDGRDNKFRCLKCVNFSFQLADRSCSVLLENEDQEINYLTGVRTENKGGFCRLFYTATNVDDQTNSGGTQALRQQNFKYCLVKKAANDFYKAPTTTTTDISRITEFNCKNFDVSSGKCLTCSDGYYLNTLNGECHGTSGTCKLTGCKQANGYAYCTLCLIGYELVDGTCVLLDIGHSDNYSWCTVVTGGECTECLPRYFLDVKGSQTNTSNKNRCRDLGNVTGCSTWAAGKCTACADSAKVLSNNKCVWAPDANFGGVPGCATFTADGVCSQPYPNAFLLKDKKSTKIISNECASYDEDGNCTSVNDINYILNFDYPTGLFVAKWRGSGGYCDKSYDDGCTCATCKPSFTISASQTCPPNYPNNDTAQPAIIPNNVIRGCIEFATATTCKQCRSPDFILTTDSQCYDLNHNRKLSGATGWVSLFIEKSGAFTGTYTTAYYPTNYEACTAASNIYTCTTCFAVRPDKIMSVALDTNAYFGSANTYCHDNTNIDFRSSSSQVGVFVNDGVSTSRDTTSLLLNRVVGCTAYTSLVAGTCATCRTDLTKQSDNLICYKKFGDLGEGTATNCGTIDPSDGQCLTCPDAQQYVYDSTNKICYKRFSNEATNFKYCLTQDFTTNKCISCIPSRIFTVNTNTAANVCKSVLDVTDLGCNGSACFVGLTATYVPAVVTPTAVAEQLQLASCGKGYTFDSTNKLCTKNKSDWSKSVAEIDASSGRFTSCSSGYTLFNSGSVNLCIPTIPNCKTYTFANNEVLCSACSNDANNISLRVVNSGRLCIPAQNYLPNCDIYNSSGSGCLKCNSNAPKLEALGCNLPPDCDSVDPNTLKCNSCSSGILNPRGDCIMPIPGKWATGTKQCQVAFNATHCAECDGTPNFVLTIDDSNNDNQYGVGECVDLTGKCVGIDGCELVLRNQDSLNCQLTTYQCIRCQNGYSMFGGQCYSNQQGNNQLFPNECVNVEYDEDQKAYLCTECDFGFAITTDRRQCIPNYGPCSYLDSTDCASYDLAQGHEEVQIECASDRESNSIIISASLMIILNIILLVI